MKIGDYPGNDEITKIREAILDLEKTHEWDAIELAKVDLMFAIKEREEWIKKNVHN